MKKYILMLFAVVAAFTSCTNDDIAINYATNFKINPATVIKPFTFENEKGELEGIPSSYNLRIRLLIYTAEGQLVKEEKELFTSYASTMGVSTHLPVGDYIAIAISDIIKKDESVTYWELSNYDMLSTATITKTDYIGDYGREILGVSEATFSVFNGNEQDVKIDIQPAGSLFMVSYWGVKKFSDVEFYELAVSKYIVDCKFDKYGNFSTTWENCDFKKRVNVHELEGNSGNNYYHYAYILPTNNLKIKYRAWLKDEKKYVDISSEMNVSPKAGEEYWVVMDLDNMITYLPELVNGSKSVSSRSIECIEQKDVHFLTNLLR